MRPFVQASPRLLPRKDGSRNALLIASRALILIPIIAVYSGCYHYHLRANGDKLNSSSFRKTLGSSDPGQRLRIRRASRSKRRPGQRCYSRRLHGQWIVRGGNHILVGRRGGQGIQFRALVASKGRLALCKGAARHRTERAAGFSDPTWPLCGAAATFEAGAGWFHPQNRSRILMGSVATESAASAECRP